MSADVQTEFTSWIDEHLPGGWRDAIERGDRDQISELSKQVDRAAIMVAMGDAGWTYPSWEPEYGGRGLDEGATTEVEDLKAEYLVPQNMNLLGWGLAAPTIRQWATEEQKRRLLNGMSRGEFWCQLFSEPGNGSDVAGLGTTAVLDGEEWVVNGQKVWTSGAHVSKRGMLIARTDPDQTKHKGISYFALDMTAPGVEIRPLRQITGDAEFNEVFLTDVRIPDADRIGPRGEGWSVAQTTLMNERVALSSAFGAQARRRAMSDDESAPPQRTGIDGLVHKAIENGTFVGAKRDRLMRLLTQARASSYNAQRAIAARKAGGQPGPEGSVGKLYGTEYNQRLNIAMVDHLGPSAMAWDPDDTATAATVFAFLRSRGNSIEGGTSEIQRNILGDRVLGLPREPDASKSMPWKDVPRN